jgi:DNA repair exonuclease SbcCD nuclease subunit
MDSVKFLHIGDTHLGYRQYHLLDRQRDFFNAFHNVLGKALANKVDFVLLAGDMFNENSIGPESLTDLYRILSEFHAQAIQKTGREIPLIVIEGNHDYGGYNVKNSWLTFLNNVGLITLLTEEFEPKAGKLAFPEYSPVTHTGGCIRIKNAVIYGIHYRGALTGALFPTIKSTIPPNPEGINILMMHFGLEGLVRNREGVAMSDALLGIHDVVDYLVLGHYHRMYMLPEKEPWIFNPGSIETVDSSEYYEQFQKGAFLVTMRGKTPKDIQIQPIYAEPGGEDGPFTIPVRAIIPLRDPIQIGGSEEPTFTATQERVLEKLRKLAIPKREKKNTIPPAQLALLYVTLKGKIEYSNMDLDKVSLRKAILDEFQVLECRIYLITESSLDGAMIDTSENLSPEQIEAQLFTAMINESSLYSPYVAELTQLMQELRSKQGALKSLQDQLTEIQTKIAGYKESIPEIERKTRQLPAMKNQLAQENTRQAQLADLMQEKGQLSAGIEQYQIFAAQGMKGECPFLHAPCKNITDPKQLNEIYRAEIRKYQQQLQGNEIAITKIRQSLEELAQLKSIYEELKEMDTQLKEKRSQLQQLEQEEAGLLPRLSQANEIGIQISTIQQKIAQLEPELKVLASLKAKRDLDRPRIGKDLESARQEAARIDRMIPGGDPATLDRFNENTFQAIEGTWIRLGKELTDITTRLEEKTKNITQLKARLENLRQRALEMKKILAHITALQKAAEFNSTIRTWIRTIGPKVTAALLATINSQATDIFQELMGQDAARLIWHEDYDIELITPQNSRRFVQLSGGEQMATALAIRLAVLKTLTKIDFAFFDEPTSNLDIDKRRNLAGALAKVKGFRQLFVISHDDTFEQHASHVVRLSKNENSEESQIDFEA